MEKKIVNNYGSFDVTFTKGKGSVLWDVNGKRYIDFIAGIGVNCLGHSYKPLVKAISQQAKRQIHISNYYLSDIGLVFADELLAITGFEKGYFGNSGAEANEAAIKLARKYGQL
ncbi:MAG: aminotransferase class III-fold pyridoxal phosphate-dependent enzyme, partial [Treponema sp.]|nr:aminotransferase class III-fold pyridoxal phosphate-dependent enzyme [Treponema sp.]